MLAFGWLEVWYEDGELMYYHVAEGNPRGPHWVVTWDVIPSLGMVGLVALPIAYFVPRDVIVNTTMWGLLPRLFGNSSGSINGDSGDSAAWTRMSEDEEGDVSSINDMLTTKGAKTKLPARLLIAIAMLTVYQLLLATWGWWFNFAHRSVHGGIFGGMLVLPAVLLIGSHVFEELQKLNREERHQDSSSSSSLTSIKSRAWAHRSQLLYLLKFSLLTGVVGALLSFVPHMFPSKRLSSSTWALVSLSTVGLVATTFMFFDKVLEFNTKKSFILLRSLGFNPFLCYNIVLVVGVNFEYFCFASKAREERAEVLLGILLPITVAAVAIWLYLRNQCIDTLKVTLGTTAIIVVGLVFKLVVASAPETDSLSLL